MPSKAEQICARIAALLVNATTAGARVYRDREDAFTREESPAILVEVIDEDTSPLGGGVGAFRPGAVDDDTLRVAVTAAVRGASWQQVADTVRVAAHAAMVADTQLLALAPGFRRDRCEWKPASADLPFGYCAQIYAFRYHTRAHALDSSL